MSAGVFVCIVGASGVGKDTLIREARARLAGNPAFHFVRRLVTRPSGAHEDHLSLSEEDFQIGTRSDFFALAWRAHDLGYAVPLSVRDTVESGAVAVCNVSRGCIANARLAFPRVATVLITAPAAVLSERLAARGRESAAEIQARLVREAAIGGILPDFTIANDGAPEEGGERLVRILFEIQASEAVDHGNIGTKPSPPHGQRAAT